MPDYTQRPTGISRFYKEDRPEEVNKIIVNTLKNIAPIELPGNHEPIQLGEDIKGYDLTEFLDDLYDFLNKYKEVETDWKEFSFQPKYTYETIDENETNALRYTIVARTNATSEQGAAATTGRKSYRWMLRDVISDRMNPGYAIAVYTKMFDNVIQLTSWSKNYRDADRFAGKLEDIIDTYSYVFKLKGLIDLRFEGRGTDTFRENVNYSWYGIPLNYYLKTFKIKLVYEKTLEQIAIDLIAK